MDKILLLFCSVVGRELYLLRVFVRVKMSISFVTNFGEDRGENCSRPTLLSTEEGSGNIPKITDNCGKLLNYGEKRSKMK